MRNAVHELSRQLVLIYLYLSNLNVYCFRIVRLCVYHEAVGEATQHILNQISEAKGRKGSCGQPDVIKLQKDLRHRDPQARLHSIQNKIGLSLYGKVCRTKESQAIVKKEKRKMKMRV